MQIIVVLPLWLVIVIWILGRTNKTKTFIVKDPVVEMTAVSFLLMHVESVCDNKRNNWLRQWLLLSVSNYRKQLDAECAKFRMMNVSVVGFIPRVDKESGD